VAVEPASAAQLADEKGKQTDGFTDSTENSEEPMAACPHAAFPCRADLSRRPVRHSLGEDGSLGEGGSATKTGHAFSTGPHFYGLIRLIWVNFLEPTTGGSPHPSLCEADVRLRFPFSLSRFLAAP
jgi:hypothetical protein